MDNSKLQTLVSEFLKKQKANPELYSEDLRDRRNRRAYYQSFTNKKILSMSEDDLYEYISKLWSMLIWGNKEYVVNRLIEDNGFENIKKQLADLLFGTNPIETRWDIFRKEFKGLGPASMSELLAYVNPKEYILFNKNTVRSLSYLGVKGLPKYDYQRTGKKFVEICGYAKEILKLIVSNGIKDADLLDVDYFLWNEVLPLIQDSQPVSSPDVPDIEKISNKDSKSLHDEIKEKIVEIGELLGFESHTEVKIAPGAVVDAVWESKVGNMGKVIYVFEVQSKGGVDSLILNLKKAQANAAVQAIVAVSDEKQIETIIKESKGVIDEKALRAWGFNDVLSVHEALTLVHESINKLSLVPESFF